MDKDLSVLKDKSLVLVFTYAPAGLGHLRVTDALYHGLPKDTVPILLGSQDKSISFLHRLTSIHPILRGVMEWTQRGLPEDIFTDFYRQYLRRRTRLIYEQLVTILDQRIDLPKTVLVISTHFGLAHQLAAIKEKIIQDKKIRLILIVVVTDDSPQHVWYVPGTDLTFVPSYKTKAALLDYGKKKGLEKIQIEVASYPLSPHFTQELSKEALRIRQDQLDASQKIPIEVSVPISGAAAGTDILTESVDSLFQRSTRFLFHMVARSTPYTQAFIRKMTERPYVKLHVSTNDREVVDGYEDIYKGNIISLEITKPSEQAFKALLSPKQRGGAVLLFTKPVGRQEYDNLEFLRRHMMIPNADEQKKLWEAAENNRPFNQIKKSWRGIILPESPKKTADFVWWCLKERIFSTMTTIFQPKKENNREDEEINPDGVRMIWEKVGQFIG